MSTRRPPPKLCALQLTILAVGAACGGDGGNATAGPPTGVTPPPGAVAEFTVSPIALDSFALVTPLGSLNPPGHTLPTAHAYMYVVDFDRRPIVRDTIPRTVYVPATGTVEFLMQPTGGDAKVQLRVTHDFSYFIDHVRLRAPLAVGTVLHAGDVLGVTNPGAALDLGALDRRVTHPGLLNPRRYPEPSLHAATPWRYFVEPLRTQLYAKQRRHPAAPPDARIDFGVAGRLAGDWFHESVPNSSEASGPAGWPRTLAFVYDYYDPTAVRIAIGGTIATPGVWAIPADAPRPASVSVATGMVAYRLLYTDARDAQAGLMLVRMLADDRIRVQVLAGSQATDGAFDDRAQVYVR